MSKLLPNRPREFNIWIETAKQRKGQYKPTWDPCLKTKYDRKYAWWRFKWKGRRHEMAWATQWIENNNFDGAMTSWLKYRKIPNG